MRQTHNTHLRGFQHVVCYLRMKQRNRKNANTPGWVKLGLTQRGFESLEGAMADELFRHLETKPNLIQSKRVEQILDLLSRLGTDNRDFFTFSQLREPLKRYKWRYRLVLGRGGLSSQLDFGEEMSEADEWEHKAVRFLLSLVPHHLNRLRRCAYCKGWFFAEKRSDQKWCKRGSCRQHHYDNDPARRADKKLYMRDYRAKEKKREERLKRGVKFRGAVKRRAKQRAPANTSLSHAPAFFWRLLEHD
jgi:hypothetical protein